MLEGGKAEKLRTSLLKQGITQASGLTHVAGFHPHIEENQDLAYGQEMSDEDTENDDTLSRKIDSQTPINA